MKRLAIFNFYDADGIVDEYVDLLLNDLSLLTDRVIIVVNGNVDENGENIFSKYTREVIIRENIGFDAGAYAFVLSKYLEKASLQEYDELILCNDTFFGPFTPLRDVFAQMEEKNVDFWGMNFVDIGLFSHIQSYFLVFRKEILKEDVFYNYMVNDVSQNETNVVHIYAMFEIGLFAELKRNGYSHGAYANTNLYDVYESAYRCMKEYQLPLFKRKCFDKTLNDREALLNDLHYIYCNTNYDVKLILSSCNRKYGQDISLHEVIEFEKEITEREVKFYETTIREKELYEWVDDDSFYIYGTGIIARELYLVFFKDSEKLLGFVVSDNQNISEQKLWGYPVFIRSQIDTSKKIVVGIGRPLIPEVRDYLGNDDKYLYLWDV